MLIVIAIVINYLQK